MIATSRSARRSLGAAGRTLLLIACIVLAGTGVAAATVSHRSAGHTASGKSHHAQLRRSAKKHPQHRTARHGVAPHHAVHRRAGAGLLGSLEAAARHSHRADRAFVADARSFERCLARHHGQGGPCASKRHGVQLAGVKLNRAERHLARIVKAGSRDTASASRRHRTTPAPSVAVEGDRLSWKRIKRAHTYVVMRRVPGQPVRYSVVHGTRFDPPAVPGLTVSYEIRTAATGSPWSEAVSIAYPAATAAAATQAQVVPAATPATEAAETAKEQQEPVVIQAAPTLTVSGNTLQWTAVAGIGTYILDTRSHGGDQYSAVHGTSFTTNAAPGTTTGYEIRTAVDGSAWSAEVKITVPAEKPAGGGNGGGGGEEKAESPSQESEASTGFQPGVNSGTTYNLDVPGTMELGAKVVRIAFEIGDSAAQLEGPIATYAAKGIRVAPLASFFGTMPSAAEAKNLASWAKAFGPGGSYWASHPGTTPVPMQTIEFGNETSYGYQYSDSAGSPTYNARAELYAQRLKEAAEAIGAGGVHVGLLAQADDWTGDWVKKMFQAVPNFGSYVAGWTIHPYGEGWKVRIEDLIKQTGEHGAPSGLPIDITEWGLATDNGDCLSENYGWNRCMSYQEAGEVLTRTVAEMRKAFPTRLGLFMLYQVRDQASSGTTTDRESYFGALQHELQPKPGFTAAVQRLMAE
ncbi:MAG TPA: hypothetical protein VGG08_00650 [Solirubrobacteraceae bacterium]|jgi:hypothetical protein